MVEQPHRLLVIFPGEKRTEVMTAKVGSLAKKVIGGGVDHGGLARFDDGRALSIVVAEFGLYAGLSGTYCALGRNLRSGNIIVYAHDYGETADITDAEVDLVKKSILWFDEGEEALEAIALGRIERPTVTVNGEVVWRWPSTERPF